MKPVRYTKKMTQKDIDDFTQYNKELGFIIRPSQANIGRYTINNNWNTGIGLFDKLGQLEDIEEELGVDLVKLLSSKEIYYKYKTGHISDCTLDSIDFNFRKICYVHKIENHSFDGCSFTEYFSDYGKTWAFTREELEK